MRLILVAAVSVVIATAAAAAPVVAQKIEPPSRDTSAPPPPLAVERPQIVASSTFSGAGPTCEAAKATIDVEYLTKLVKTDFKTDQITVTERCEKVKTWFIAYMTFTAK